MADDPNPPDTIAAPDGAAPPSRDPGARLPTALFTGEFFLEHHVPAGFPERPERLRQALAMIEALVDQGTIPADHVVRLDPRAASAEELGAVHAATYIERVRSAVAALAASQGESAPSPIRKFATDVYLSPGTYDAAV